MLEFKSAMDVFMQLASSYLIDKDIPTILSCVSSDVVWIGSDPDEIVIGRENLELTLSKTLDNTFDSYSYEIRNLNEREISNFDTFIVADLIFKKISPDTMNLVMKVTANIHNSDGSFLVTSLHTSFTSRDLTNLAYDSALLNRELELYNNTPFTSFHICEDTPNFEFIYASETFFNLFESERENLDIQNKLDYKKYVHPDDLDKVKDIFDSARKENINPVDWEVRILTAKNNIKYLRCHTIRNTLNGRDVLSTINIDITRTKTIEARLSEENSALQQRYQDAMAYQDATIGKDVIMLGHCNLDLDVIVNITDMTPNNISKYFSTSCTELISSLSGYITDKSLVCEFAKNINVERLRGNFKKGITSCTFKTKMQFDKNTSEQICEVNVKLAISPASQQLIGFLTIVDMTKQEITSELVTHAVEHDYDYISYLDAKRDSFFYIASKTTSAMLPLADQSYSDTMKAYLETCALGKDKKQLLEKFSVDTIVEELKTKDFYAVYFDAYQKNGSIANKKIRFSYIKKEDKTILMTQRDITDILSEEEKKRAILDVALLSAKQASTAKTEFLSHMSHEIRTPMNAIVGMSTIAANNIDNPTELKNCLAKIGISSRFLLSLINDILDMSRIESGKMLLQKKLVLFDDFIQNIATVSYSQANIKNIDFDCVVDKNIEHSYMFDELKLEQVINNIVGNAIKFTPDRGKVTIRVGHVKNDKDDAILRFVITDTGCGIEESFLPHLFEPFAQEHDSSTTRYAGTGLGLAICKNIVELMGGKIVVHSIKNRGTEFNITVKVGLTEENIAFRKAKINYNFDQWRTLVVDDDAIVCENTVQILSDMGIQAQWVDNGKKAIDLVKAEELNRSYFNMILLDWKMPEMDGIETARQLRKIVGPDVTIIIMTAFDWASIEVEARRAGVDMFMSKPMLKSTLVSAFRRTAGLGQEFLQKTDFEDFSFEGKRVLVCEDHPINVEVAKKLLTAKGFEVDVAENGLIAIKKISSVPENYYDAILMDIRMPIMDGLTATTTIRNLSLPGVKEIPIIAMTANAFSDDIDKSIAAGMNAHLSKPIEPPLLYKTLYEYIYKTKRK
ncbi:MAG: response regulator [Synergistaceae bacterium]